MIKVLYQIEAKQAAWIASITMAIPILTNPLVGIFIDRTQRRTWPILFGTGCLLLAFMVMLYPSSHSLIAVIPPILVALSLSCTPLAMVMIAARLMPENRFGTLLGLRSSVGNIGTVWVGSLAGPIQDLSARIQLGPDQGYLGVVRLFVLLSLGAMVMAWLVWYIGRHKMDGDARINHVRTLKRVDVEEEDMLSDEDALALHIVDRDVHRTSYAYPQGNLICAYLLIVMAIGAVVMFAFAIILR
jgi:MFS family permease